MRKGRASSAATASCPRAGPAYVSDDEAAKRPPNALADNLRASLEKGPVKFRLLVQVAAADDPTRDATKVWPDSRPTVELGEIAVTKALDTKKVENELLFLPTNVTSGIDVSDDPIMNTRTEAYGESYGGASNELRNNRRVSHEQAAIGAACHVPTAPWSLNARRNSINSRLAKGVGVIGGVAHQAASSSRECRHCDRSPNI